MSNECSVTPLTKKSLAEDVIKQIQAKKYVATSQYYDMNMGRGDGDARTSLRNMAHCNVCAKGALFLSALEKKNVLTTFQAYQTAHGHKLVDYLEVFSQQELDEIENAFEITLNTGVAYSEYAPFIEEQCGDLEYWHYDEMFDRDRWLIYIMEYIVRNDGFRIMDFVNSHPPELLLRVKSHEEKEVAQTT